MITQLLENKYVRQVKEHWLTIGFVFGFFTDLILLNKIDDFFDNFMLFFYASLATISFLFFYIGTAERAPGFLSRIFKQYAPVLMQYAFGGLLSGMLIFYGRSGDWLVSAPFLLLIIAVILGNEFVTKRSNRLIYHLSLYFIGIYSYIVLVLPVLFGKMGDLMFFLSGVVALIVVTIVIQLLYRIVPHFMELNTRAVILTVGFIYIGFNVLYFTNIIPPIPLSLTQLEVVHDVSRFENGSYRIVTETKPWWQSLLPHTTVIHPSLSAISCYASVYAPTRLTTDIYHTWEYKNEGGEWVQHFRTSYPVVSSGTVRGYRGYTTISSFNDGTWRCTVETERGQVLGRETFIIDRTQKPHGLITKIE